MDGRKKEEIGLEATGGGGGGCPRGGETGEVLMGSIHRQNLTREGPLEGEKRGKTTKVNGKHGRYCREVDEGRGYRRIVMGGREQKGGRRWPGLEICGLANVFSKSKRGKVQSSETKLYTRERKGEGDRRTRPRRCWGLSKRGPCCYLARHYRTSRHGADGGGRGQATIGGGNEVGGGGGKKGNASFLQPGRRRGGLSGEKGAD